MSSLKAEASVVASQCCRPTYASPRSYNFSWEALVAEAIVLAVRYIVAECRKGGADEDPDGVRRRAEALKAPRLCLRAQRRRLEALVDDAFRAKHVREFEAVGVVGRPSPPLDAILARVTAADDATIRGCWREALSWGTE